MTDEPVTPAAEPVTPAATPPAPPATEFKIPDAYKEKPWASKIKTEDDVYKQIDNLNSLVGKKSVLPDLKTAKPEELDSYFSQLRPQDKAAYKFADITPQPLKEVYADALYDAGVSEYQANKLIGKISEFEKAEMAKLQSPEEFDKKAKEIFGEGAKERTDSLFKSLVELNVLGEKEKLVYDMSTNDQQLMLYKLADAYEAKFKKLAEEYGAKETGAQTGGSGTPAPIDLAAEADKLYTEIAEAQKLKPPRFDHIEQLKQKLREINTKRAAS